MVTWQGHLLSYRMLLVVNRCGSMSCNPGYRWYPFELWFHLVGQLASSRLLLLCPSHGGVLSLCYLES